MSPRHLSAVPDLDSPWVDAYAEMLTALGPPPLLTPRRRPRAGVFGEPAAPAPGWWVCPTCGRRVDRAGEARTVTARYCTGPDGALRHRRHTAVAMEMVR